MKYTADGTAPPPVILSATPWPDNGHLVRDVFTILEHQLPAVPRCIDLTYGDGVWWREVDINPSRFIGDFTKPTVAELDCFREKHDVVAFDPPYVLQGGKPKGGDGFAEAQMKFRKRYGIDKPRNIVELRAMIGRGLSVAQAFTKPGGFVLVKAMPFVTSGKIHWIPDDITEWMKVTGWSKFDEFHYLRPPGPQPNHARQLHSRRNHSTLQVWQRPKQKASKR